jgi:hypothetical protein
MPAPRACKAEEDRSKTVTSQPASRSTSAAVRPPSEPPMTMTRGIADTGCDPSSCVGGRVYGRPKVAIFTTSISNSTRRSSIDGSRSP